MDEVIRTFPEQFAFEPAVANADGLAPSEEYVVGGMGGSRLPADMLRTIRPELPLFVHNTYGIPAQPDARLRNARCIAVSHSGNTEETLSFAERALEKGYPLAAVTTGGKLLALAKERKLPHVIIPAGLQPRHSLGYLTVALAKLLDGEAYEALRALAGTLRADAREAEGNALADGLRDKTPLLYASERFAGVARVWKISVNENAKVPAFYNTLPEADHNELAGFALNEETESFAERFAAVFLEDDADDERIKRRVATTKEIYASKGVRTFSVPLRGKTVAEQAFDAVLLANIVSFRLAEAYGSDPLSSDFIEDFKKRIL